MLCNRIIIEVSFRADYPAILQMLLYLCGQPVFMRHTSKEIKFVLFSLHPRQFPDVKQIIEYVMSMCRNKRVAESETVLLETKDLQLLFMEVSIQLSPCSRERTPVAMGPY